MEAKPYPFRFKCEVMNSGYVKIIKQSDFPEWDAGHIDKKVVVYLKYTIDTNQVDGNTAKWYATAFTHVSLTNT